MTFVLATFEAACLVLVGCWLSRRSQQRELSSPATCCGCGDRGAEVAAWGPDSDPQGGEPYCGSCYSTSRYFPGTLVCPVPLGLTWREWEGASARVWQHRHPVPAYLTRAE